MSEQIEDPITEPIKETIALFQEDLSSVTFPDVSKSILENLVEQVRMHAAELEEANAKANTAREALEASQNDLLQKCIRGLSYAKVFSEDKDELQEKISKICLGKSSKAPKKTEKARSEKQNATDQNEKNDKKTGKVPKKSEEQNVPFTEA